MSGQVQRQAKPGGKPKHRYDILSAVKGDRIANAIKSENWKECAGSNGIDAGAIEKCFANEGKQLLRENIKIAEGLGIGASPSWLANNKVQFSGLSAEEIKTQLCKANPSLKNCDRKLTGPDPAAKGGARAGRSSSLSSGSSQRSTTTE